MKLKKKLKFIIPAVIVIVIVVALLSRPGGQALNMEETVEKRDITTYRNFTGIIEAENSIDILPLVAANVMEVKVSEGDEVKEGDVIAVLDSSSIEQEIALKEAGVKDSKLSSGYSVAEAKKAYEDYKYALDNGLNSQINQADSQIDAAEINLNTANQNYADNENLIANAQAVRNAIKAELDNAIAAFNNQQVIVNDLATKGETNPTEEAKLLEFKTAVQASQAAYDSIINEDNLDGLVAKRIPLESAVASAQNTYDSAVSSYNEAKLSVNQTLENYASTAKKAGELSNNSTAPIELDSLNSRLEDYTIIAPMDGVVTSLNLNVGEMPATAGPAATVTNFDGMKISIKINEYDILGVETGKPVDITVSALDKTYKGTIESISKTATVENGVSYFTADINFEKDEYIRSGMSVEVKLKNNDVKDAISVSMNALNYEFDNRAYVLVKGEDGVGVKQYVTTGITDGFYAQITEGLAEGDVVLIIPTFGMVGGVSGGPENAAE